jgi:hypothetical protein
MGRLDQLRQNLLDMNPEQLRERVREIRRERRIVKEKPAAKVAKRVEGAKAKAQLAKMLEGMTPEQISKLLKGK